MIVQHLWKIVVLIATAMICATALFCLAHLSPERLSGARFLYVKIRHGVRNGGAEIYDDSLYQIDKETGEAHEVRLSGNQQERK
jgi:hypothetical protein